MPTPLARMEYAAGQLPAVMEFLKRVRGELRMLRCVRVFVDRVQVCDVNGDYFEIAGLGYASPDVSPVLRETHCAFDPATLHAATPQPFKEFRASRRHPWAEDRVM